jgi:hypothetical protein
LFEAALNDQELFEELAGEYELKLLLEEPGVRTRLLASLAPTARNPSWTWAWIAGAAAAAGLAAIIAVAVLRESVPKQIAGVRTSPATPASAPVIESAPPPPAPIAPKRKTVPSPRGASTAPDSTAPNRPASAPAPITSTGNDKQAAVGGLVPQAAPPQFAIPPEAVTPAAIPARGITAGAIAGLGAVNRFAEVAPVGRFAFDYEVTSDRKLRIVPAANGFLTVSIREGGTIRRLADNARGQARASFEFSLPFEETIVTIVFSALPVSQPAAQTNASVADDGLSGAKVDPNPSPGSQLIAVIHVKASGMR